MMEYIAAFDARVLQALYDIRDPSLVQLAIWISELGRAWTVYGFAACGIIFLAYRRHYAYAAGLAISVAACGAGVLLLKGIVERIRPPVEFQAYLEVWYSMPSAHAALSVALYGFAAFLVWKFIANLNLRYLTIATLLFLILLVSFTRMYLGVHYFSDVFVGLLVGSICLRLGIRWARFAHTQ